MMNWERCGRGASQHLHGKSQKKTHYTQSPTQISGLLNMKHDFLPLSYDIVSVIISKIKNSLQVLM